ncbi:hypothetical protein LAZ67_2005195 [Cordylochernes scorpioides]|uniref:Uncharacterized protein n=1 Tax=Cordylochernes scorpioides TaxID=51811 RepID=A0ABY6K5S0_9ARAC|nr:hypothetical protein LAZ67_2005195 [Cordylochernes scorpioides]
MSSLVASTTGKTPPPMDCESSQSVDVMAGVIKTKMVLVDGSYTGHCLGMEADAEQPGLQIQGHFAGGEHFPERVTKLRGVLQASCCLKRSDCCLPPTPVYFLEDSRRFYELLSPVLLLLSLTALQLKNGRNIESDPSSKPGSSSSKSRNSRGFQSSKSRAKRKLGA